MNSQKAELIALIWAFLMTTIDFWVNAQMALGTSGIMKTISVLLIALVLYYVVARIAIGIIRFSLDVIRSVRRGY